MSPHTRRRLIAMLIGVVLLGSGAYILGGPLLQRAVSIAKTDQRQKVDNQALNSWNSGGDKDLAGAAVGGGQAAPSLTTCSPGGGDVSAYALVDFTSLPQYGYAGIAGNGTWSLLDTRSMVHYQTTPAPGAQGNVIIAFHREPDYEYVDQLTPGGTVTIQDRQCNTYVYAVSNVWTEAPQNVSQLDATTGYNLTMITCTPFWQDYDRIVWRANLTSVNGKPFSG